MLTETEGYAQVCDHDQPKHEILNYTPSHRGERPFQLCRNLKKVDDIKTTKTIAMKSGVSGDDGFDFEQTLKDLVQRRGEKPIKARELGVMFNDLCVVGLGARASLQPTMGSMFNPFTTCNPPIRDILRNSVRL